MGSMKSNHHPLHSGILPFMLLIFFIFCFQSLFCARADSTYDNFANCLTKNGVPNNQIPQILYTPSNASFTSVLNSYVRNLRFNTSTSRKPSIIVTPFQVQQVQATIKCSKGTGLQLKIRSGGHDFEGISYVSNTPFIILDMFNFSNISIDIPSQTAWVQSGATLGEFYYSIWRKSNVFGFPAGVCPTVGVGGHISGGGYGPMLRKYGLTVDNVVDAQIIDVNGNILDIKGMGEDLFWAIRGGGGASFGVVLSYKVNLVQVPSTVTVFNVQRTEARNAADILVKWQNVAASIDNNLFIRVIIQPVPIIGTRKMTIQATFLALYLGDSVSLMNLMNSQFPELGLKQSDCLQMSWIQSIVYWANTKNSGSRPDVLLRRTTDSVSFGKKKSDYVLTPIPKAALTFIFNKMIQLGKVGMEFNPYGGRMSQIAESDAPFPHRRGIIYKIQYSISWGRNNPELTNQYLGQARELYSFMTPYVSSNPRRAFLNYRDLDIGITSNGINGYSEGKVYGLKYFVGNFDRLVKVKTAVDPQNFFRNEQSIPILPS
ncbi:OLC1v1021230C1 [Oldenlandia corymbosa var. corymbosa]|uniref:OLC1v1021230C1 n=1 Tax=Oldenlandia corymbosa var. corymbosa TaxID=529605 RepID=A0AAV1BV70_OLDCO|nr:OLC1v1021230C1 [Oldenlandia corymbosa var. corymbosa]